MTKEQTAATVTAISDLMQALRCATTEAKAEIYAGLKAEMRHAIPAGMLGQPRVLVRVAETPGRSI
jgi:hypothetical protein